MINIKFLRGTKAQNDAYIGKVGTVTLDLTDKSLRVHDGVTAGGKKIPNTTAVEQLIENYLFLHSNSGDHDSRYYTQTQVDNKIANISSYDDSGIRTLIDGKVDKVTGKGLSANDFTNVLKDKLDAVESGAEKNVGTNLGLSGTGNAKTLTSSTGSNVSLPISTTTNAGLMSTGDKTKLNSVEAGAEVNVGTSLGSSRNATSYTVTSSTGNNTSLASASTTAAGVMSATDKAKLDGVATGAEVNSVTSVAGKAGDVNLSKSDVGLGSVDNTSDADKPVSTTQQSALNDKVDVSAIVNDLVSTATTQPLSANQGRVLKSYVDAINDVLQSNDGTLDELQEIVDYIKANRSTLEALGISNIAGLQTALNAKVDAVTGKGLSSNDYTDSEKNKLSGIASGAEVNVGTNLGLSGTGNAKTLTSSTGGNVSLPTATTSNAGLMSTSDKVKLNGVEAGAEKNVGDSFNATGTYASLRAQATTKADVGLSAVRNVASYSQSEADDRFVRRDAETVFDVGRGAVYLENNGGDNVNGAGITLRSSNNPTDGGEGSAGSIFSVRSSGGATRLWVGQSLTTTGSNDFKTVNADVSGDLDVLGVLSGDGSGLTTVDADKVDGLHASQFLRSDADDAKTHKTQYNLGIIGEIENNSNSTKGLEIKSHGGSDAFITFHSSGTYAAHLGLDASSQDLAWGGYSAGSNVYKVFHEGNLDLSTYVRSNQDDTLDGVYTFTSTDTVVIGGSGTIAGSNWSAGHFHLGDSSTGWAMDSNELYNSSQAIIGTMAGNLQLIPANQLDVRGKARIDGAIDDGINALQVAGGVRADSFSAGGAQNAQESIDTGGNIQIRNQGQLKMGNFSLQYNADTESLDFSWIGG